MMPPGQGKSNRRGSSLFLFVLDKLESVRCKLGVCIVYGYHTNVSAGIHGKLICGWGR